MRSFLHVYSCVFPSIFMFHRASPIAFAVLGHPSNTDWLPGTCVSLERPRESNMNMRHHKTDKINRKCQRLWYKTINNIELWLSTSNFQSKSAEEPIKFSNDPRTSVAVTSEWSSVSVSSAIVCALLCFLFAGCRTRWQIVILPSWRFACLRLGWIISFLFTAIIIVS